MIPQAQLVPYGHHAGSIDLNPADWNPDTQDVLIWLAVGAVVGIAVKAAGATALVATTAGVGAIAVAAYLVTQNVV